MTDSQTATGIDELYEALKVMSDEQREAFFAEFRIQGISSPIETAWRQAHAN